MDLNPYNDWLNFNIPESLSSVKVQPVAETIYTASQLKQIATSALVSKIIQNALRVAQGGGRELIVYEMDEDV